MLHNGSPYSIIRLSIQLSLAGYQADRLKKESGTLANLSYLSDTTKQVFDDFKHSLKSEKSQKEYYYIINAFCSYCGKDYLVADANDFKGYFESLETGAAIGNISTKTICTRYAVMINFSAYIVSHAQDYGITSFVNYMIKVKKPGVSINIRPQSIPSLEQLDQIYTAAQTDYAMYCIIALVNKCALTVEQICKLKLQNFIIDSEMNCGMLFPYQYSADKYVKLPDDVRDILNEYVNDIRNSPTEFLFCNAKGGQLTPRVLQNRMKRIVDMAAEGEQWNFTLQDIRNLSVVLMLKGGAEAEDVASYIGINSKWMQKFDRAVEDFVVAPCDFINISIK